MASTIKSNFEKIKNQCLAQGKLWEDPDFPANDAAIGPKAPDDLPITWKRPHEISEITRTKPEFILDGGDRFDVFQGSLGDCWMLSALASLTTSPQLFKFVVPQDQSFQKGKYAGVFRFHFWKYGEWVEVLVDDRLPMHYWNMAYAQSSKLNEFWAPLLEKAYSKFYGNYKCIVGGRPYEALTDFTGCLTQILFTGDQTPKDLAKVLFQAVERHSILSTNVSNPKAPPKGLPLAHAYSITGITKVENENGADVCLIRVRNPWGNETEWTGRWSDSSNEWKRLTPSAQKAVGYINREDGEFWIEITDFLQYFDSVEVCYMNPADVFSTPEKQRPWSISTFHGKWIKNKTSGGHNMYAATYVQNPQFAVTLKDSDADEDDKASFVVELTQMNRRRQKLEHLTIGFHVYRLPPGVSLPMNQKHICNYIFFVGQCRFINSRAVSKSFTVDPGTYVIIPSTAQANDEAEFMLRVFSETDHTSRAI